MRNRTTTNRAERKKRMYYLGVDLGSLSCDAVLIGDNGSVLASAVVPTGAKNREAIARATHDVLNEAGISETDLSATVSTGYGRERVEGRLAAVTEITCHARGIHEVLRGTEVLIDIGGQDSKAVRLDEDGRVVEFAMNDKCAAGTGRFLEAMARALQVDIDELGELDRGATGNLTLSSMCTVFAESEVVSLIADGVAVNEIAGGLSRAIASRVAALVRRICPEVAGLSVAMSGGVAYNKGVVRAVGAALQTNVVVPPKPDTVGAFGASLIARERSIRNR
jgi:predicted CoA-substrate-specific enzyme activase